MVYYIVITTAVEPLLSNASIARDMIVMILQIQPVRYSGRTKFCTRLSRQTMKRRKANN